MVPPEQPRSYYGRPVIKPPVWKPEVPWYLFLGGLAGASATLAWTADATGNRRLGRNAGHAVTIIGVATDESGLIEQIVYFDPGTGGVNYAEPSRYQPSVAHTLSFAERKRGHPEASSR